MTAHFAAAVAASLSQDRTSRRRRPDVWLLYHASRLARRRSGVCNPEDLERTTDVDQYRNWRVRELESQLAENFHAERIAGLDVLDFGCGSGELCLHLAKHKPRRLTGVDISRRAIGSATALIGTLDPAVSSRVRFFQNEVTKPVPIESASIGLICCFDALEHLANVPSVVREWHRMLQAGGRVWIWWSPWRGPFGHHMESLIPLPWAHLILSERAMFGACAELYDAPDFVPRIWDRDPESGHKMPNKWRQQQHFHPFLNRLTRRSFERCVRQAGLVIKRRETHGFSGSPLRRATRSLLPVPGLGECFVSHFVYELIKSA